MKYQQWFGLVLDRSLAASGPCCPGTVELCLHCVGRALLRGLEIHLEGRTLGLRVIVTAPVFVYMG